MALDSASPRRSSPTPASPAPSLGRRSFLSRSALLGGAGFLALGAPTLLAACGGSSGSDDGAPSLELTAQGGQLVGLFNYQGNYLVTEAPQRAVFTIASAEGPPALDGPTTLTAQLSREGIDKGEFRLERYAQGTPIGYYPLFTTFDEPGIWGLTTTIDGEESTQNFQVQEPDQVALVQPGEQMVPVDTPTVNDARGVTPICTRDPDCPLHSRSLADVLAAGQPVALMISTPLYCQTAVCGPVLDMVTAEAAARPDLAVVHAEVYLDPAAGSDPGAGGTTPTIDRYGLTFEPSLYVARADGTITARLDNVFDTAELARALDTATA